MTPRETLDTYYASCNELSSRSIGYFLDRCVIDSHPEPRPFGEVADDWQRDMIIPKAMALEGLVGLREYTGPRSFATFLARGHDKSSAEGRLLSWALCYSPREINACLCAADLDQGKGILEAMMTEAKLNPWYADKLKFTRNEVTGPSGKVKVLPADDAGSYGGRYNIIICDEITHWKNDRMWGAIGTGREKVPGSILVIISNAGLKGSWQEQYIYDTAKADPNEWRLFETKGSVASWMTQERIAKMCKTIPPLLVRRVIGNEWIDPAEESGYLTRSEIAKCYGKVNTVYHGQAQYIAAVDYGETKDRTALSIVYQDVSNKINVVELKVIRGSHENPVQVAEVEKWVKERHKQYKFRNVIFDPHQMVGTIQALELAGVPIERFASRGGAGNLDLSSNLRNLIINERLVFDENAGLDFKEELANLVVTLTPAGWKLDHKSGRHDDQAVSVGMASLYSVKYPYIRKQVVKTENLLPPSSPRPLFG